MSHNDDDYYRRQEDERREWQRREDERREWERREDERRRDDERREQERRDDERRREDERRENQRLEDERRRQEQRAADERAAAAAAAYNRRDAETKAHYDRKDAEKKAQYDRHDDERLENNRRNALLAAASVQHAAEARQLQEDEQRRKRQAATAAQQDDAATMEYYRRRREEALQVELGSRKPEKFDALLDAIAKGAIEDAVESASRRPAPRELSSDSTYRTVEKQYRKVANPYRAPGLADDMHKGAPRVRMPLALVILLLAGGAFYCLNMAPKKPWEATIAQRWSMLVGKAEHAATDSPPSSPKRAVSDVPKRKGWYSEKEVRDVLLDRNNSPAAQYALAEAVESGSRGLRADSCLAERLFMGVLSDPRAPRSLRDNAMRGAERLHKPGQACEMQIDRRSLDAPLERLVRINGTSGPTGRSAKVFGKL